MSQKTEAPETSAGHVEAEFSPDFVRVLISLTVATLILVFLFERKFLIVSEYPGVRIYLFPWVVAAGHTIGNALREFSGQMPQVVTLQMRLAALLGLLFGFVIGPTLFFVGWYERRKERLLGVGRGTLRGSALISIIGGVLLFAVALPTIPIAFIRHNVEQSLRSAQAIQEEKDNLIGGLNMVAFKAYEYKIVPRSLNGGEGSYAGYTIPQHLASVGTCTYNVTVAEDAVRIVAISTKYPDGRISANLKKGGQFNLVDWKYEGVFE
ncbi:MAG TPA: hypothetical protein VMH23_18435 [Bacteroidota bacterium]|nr:hypothetical protein [Bacteroidota bacterium]